jgi:hypothetical protein
MCNGRAISRCDTIFAKDRFAVNEFRRWDNRLDLTLFGAITARHFFNHRNRMAFIVADIRVGEFDVPLLRIGIDLLQDRTLHFVEQ